MVDYDMIDWEPNGDEDLQAQAQAEALDKAASFTQEILDILAADPSKGFLGAETLAALRQEGDRSS